MKYSCFLVISGAALAMAGPAAIVGSLVSSVVGRKGKRDLEFEDALLVIRDRTIQEWDAAVYNPATISTKMLAALKAKGYSPPAHVKAAYSGPSGAQPGQTLAKEYALKSIQAGYDIPPSTLKNMQKAGWTGPGLTKRGELEWLEAREVEDDFELFVRDFDFEDY